MRRNSILGETTIETALMNSVHHDRGHSLLESFLKYEYDIESFKSRFTEREREREEEEEEEKNFKRPH
jgi:hypothetical protein